MSIFAANETAKNMEMEGGFGCKLGYPFGSKMPMRVSSLESYRYGFGGHEKIDEVKGDGNHLSFGDYGYDPRLGRRWNSDPEWQRLAGQSPYSANNNSPISFVDSDGRWAIFHHYKMTEKALVKAGMSTTTAREIAHYASTYADNPNKFISGLNQVLGVFWGVKPSAIRKDESKYGDYSTNSLSQSDEFASSNSIHSMQAYWENLPKDVVVDRALYGGEYQDAPNDDMTIIITGALNVINSYKGVSEEDLTEEDKMTLGIAFHTIQDVSAHNGGRWVNENKGDAKKLGNKKEHNTLKDVFGNKKQAKNASKNAAETLMNGNKDSGSEGTNTLFD